MLWLCSPAASFVIGVGLPPTYDFTAQVALVTGAAKGMGLATARMFAESGASVVLADLDGDLAAKEAERIVAEGGTAIGIACDVADEAQVAAMVDRTVSEYGRLDMAFNNAARASLLRTTASTLRGAPARFRPVSPLRPELPESILLSPEPDASVSPARWQDERRVALTERFAKSAETGGRKSPTFYDDEVISFGLQVRENGRNTFTLHYPYTSASTAFCHSRTLS